MSMLDETGKERQRAQGTVIYFWLGRGWTFDRETWRFKKGSHSMSYKDAVRQMAAYVAGGGVPF